MKNKYIYIFFMYTIITGCGDLHHKADQGEVTSAGKLSASYKQMQLQKRFDSLRVKLKFENQYLENTKLIYEKNLEIQKNKINNNLSQITLENRKIKTFENNLDEKKKIYNLIKEQISNEVWITERDSKLRELDSKRQSISRLSEEIRGIDIERINDRQLRILDRSIQYHREEFERIHEPVPDIITDDIKRLKSELDRARLALKKIMANLDTQENIIITEASGKERDLSEELSSLEKEIEEYNNKIKQSQKHVKTLNREINKARSEIGKLDSLFKGNSIDIIKEIKDLQSQFADTFGRLSRLLYSELKIHSPELKEVYSQFLGLEDKIIKLCNEGKWDAARVLIVSIDVQWDNFASFIIKAERDYSVFKNLYIGEPFFIHFKRIDSQRYSLKEEFKNYRIVFKHQMDILKDYLDYYPASTIFIDGHADRIEYLNNIYSNVDLSQRRANKIKKMILEHHVIKQKTKIIVDWYSKHLNRPIFQPYLVENDSGSFFDRRVEMRIIRPYKENEKIPDLIRKFKMFRDSLKVEINGSIRYFKHENGFWEQLNYHLYRNAPRLQIYYQGEVYKALLKNPAFKTLTARRDSSAITTECRIKDIRSFEFGSQFRMVLFIDGNPFRIEICRSRRGAKKIRDIRNRKFRNYLSALVEN